MTDVTSKYKKVIKILNDQAKKQKTDNYLQEQFTKHERQQKYKALGKITELENERDEIKASYEALLNKQQEEDPEIEEILRNIGKGLTDEEKREIDEKYANYFNKDLETELMEYRQQTEEKQRTKKNTKK